MITNKQSKETKQTAVYARIEGIYCAHCVETITRTLRALEGVEDVSLRQNVARLTGTALPSAAQIVEAVRGIGYETDAGCISKSRRSVAGGVPWYEVLLIAVAVGLVFFGSKRLFGYNIFNAIPAVDSSLSYGMLFVTGLGTSLHCISMCGAIGIAASAESNTVRSFRRPLLYNAGRVISYTLIGGIVGLVGSAFTVSAALRGAVVLAAAVCMLLMALSMLGLFRFDLPRLFRFRVGGRQAGAFVIGLLNGLMPCGPLQAMQLYALASGGFFSGALAMGLFALGTVPLMLLSGAALSLSRGTLRRAVGRIAPVLMLILALSMLNRALLSFGVDVTDGFVPRYEGYLAAETVNGVQYAEFALEYDSYADIVVQKDVPVRITVHAAAEKITGCNNEIVCPALGFDVPLQPGDNLIEFTPTETGEYVYTCWMNMIRNRILVVDRLN